VAHLRGGFHIGGGSTLWKYWLHTLVTEDPAAIYLLNIQILCGMMPCIADTQYNLQKAAYKLNQIITEYGLTMSVQKTKSWHLKDRIQ